MRMKLFSVAIGALLYRPRRRLRWRTTRSLPSSTRTSPVKLEGTVTKMDWINPHSWIHIDVTTSSGEVQKWMVEGGAPNALLRRGWNRNSLPTGTKIKVQGFQAKDGSFRANGRDITFADGSKLFVGSSGIGAPDERPE